MSLFWERSLFYKNNIYKNHTNKRVSPDEFPALKSAGKYKFGSLPVINFKNGASQMGQTQSMMRWIASTSKGKNGEKLWPGKADPESSFQIDQLV